MPLVTRIDSIFVPAIDSADAAAWYKRMFGMTEIFESAGYVGLGFAEGAPGQAALTLYPADSIDRDRHYAFNLYAPDAEALHAALTAEGVEATAIDNRGPLKFFEFRDYSGNWVGVCHMGGGH